MKAWPEPERRPLPPTRNLWAIVRYATPTARAAIYRTIRRSTPPDRLLAELLLASGAIE